MTMMTSKQNPDPRSSDVLSDKLESWLARAENDTTPEEFIAQFEGITLPAWDHYTHIRIAYVILTTHGRQKGKNYSVTVKFYCDTVLIIFFFSF